MINKYDCGSCENVKDGVCKWVTWGYDARGVSCGSVICMDYTPRIKPCAQCGGMPRLIHAAHWRWEHYCNEHCGEYGHQVPTKEEAIDSWNRFQEEFD